MLAEPSSKRARVDDDDVPCARFCLGLPDPSSGGAVTLGGWLGRLLRLRANPEAYVGLDFASAAVVVVRNRASPG